MTSKTKSVDRSAKLLSDAAKVNEKSGNNVEIKWLNVIAYLILHLMAFYGLWVALTQATWKTLVFTCKLC